MRPFPAAFDLAFHFATYASVLVSKVEEIPSREHQKNWLRNYFDEMGKAGDEKLIEDYLDGIELMIPLAIWHFLIAGIFLGQVGTSGTQDGFDYVGVAVKKYALFKELMKNIEIKYKQFSISFEKN